MYFNERMLIELISPCSQAVQQDGKGKALKAKNQSFVAQAQEMGTSEAHLAMPLGVLQHTPTRSLLERRVFSNTEAIAEVATGALVCE
jgi:hypothetical protein